MDGLTRHQHLRSEVTGEIEKPILDRGMLVCRFSVGTQIIFNNCTSCACDQDDSSKKVDDSRCKRPSLNNTASRGKEHYPR